MLKLFYSNLPVTNSKPLPPFVFDTLYYLNRDQLERFSIVCRSLKNFIERYFHSKPYRVFDELRIRSGSYALRHNGVQWHPNRAGYSVQQFFAGQECDVDLSKYLSGAYYSFAEMRPYLGSLVRVATTTIYVPFYTYNAEHIMEMESIVHLWSDYDILIRHAERRLGEIDDEDFEPILNSPTILKCKNLFMINARFSFKNYKVLYTVENIAIQYDEERHFWTTNFKEKESNYLPQFLEQPGVKPVVTLRNEQPERVTGLLDRLHKARICVRLLKFIKAFSSATMPNAFKIVFAQCKDPLTEFRETNKTSGEILELKKGSPAEYEDDEEKDDDVYYTLERSSI
ncbi:hypothetical protein Ddc_13189 [Ditylenchus destructor]|nr:hypothetical protein Ddc_13189 [Ditylenchus destructor]